MLLNPLKNKIIFYDGSPLIPGYFPGVGHLPSIIYHAPRFFRYAEDIAGDFFWIKFGTSRMLTCNRQESLELLSNKTTNMNFQGELASFMKNTMAATDGERHRELRLLPQHAFSPSGIASSGIMEEFSKKITNSINKWIVTGNISLMREISELSLSMFFIMLGTEVKNTNRLQNAIHKYFCLLAMPFSSTHPFHFVKKTMKSWINDQMKDLIDKSRNSTSQRGLLPIITRSFDAQRGSMTHINLVDTLLLMILASFETTSYVMAQAILQLILRPEALEQLSSEAKNRGAPPTSLKDLEEFPYAFAFFRETLRFFPPLNITFRRATIDFHLAGKHIEKNTDLVIPIHLLSRNNELYSEPDEFLPERWLAHTKKNTPIETIQFGAGPHFCLGYHVAQAEIMQFLILFSLSTIKNKCRPRLIKAGLGYEKYFPTGRLPNGTRIGFS